MTNSLQEIPSDICDNCQNRNSCRMFGLPDDACSGYQDHLLALEETANYADYLLEVENYGPCHPRNIWLKSKIAMASGV